MIRGTRREDFERIELHPVYHLVDPNAKARAVNARGRAWTVENAQGEIVFIIGWTPVWEGVIEVWNLTSPLVRKYPKLYYKTIKTIMGTGIKDIHRIQTLVYTGFDESIRVHEHLGFKNEGKLEKFGPKGHDFYIFGRVF